ncbi:protein unc-13 homolog D isoform X2 [Acipenser ruthenus]|uniref:protein unc-13 homolog D isoform X2 n=2 Tax=Acipenser ruthenus TaxID=7906 RepID=UPI00145A259C|nr:protein unc-13 homolog D isoform X2 [Acipenser ruthenus]
MMDPSHNGAMLEGESQPHRDSEMNPTASRIAHGQQGSPAPMRKLGTTRKPRDRKVFNLKDEDPEDTKRRVKELELKPLYKEMLYTILHRLGKPSPEHISDNRELFQYVQKAFSMSQAEHEELLLKVQGLEPPTSCLMVTVKEAKGILGKDVSGFSDPYCMLAIVHPSDSPFEKSSKGHGPLFRKPKKAVVKNTISEDFIQRSSVKKQTLNPIWDETFVLEFEDNVGAEFHMDMWDMDEIETLGQKLGEITDLHSLKRIFKDAKKGQGQDDFLGNVVIKLEDLHCTEDEWYILEPRTETYPDRGKCHLQFKFIHKERDISLGTGQPAYTTYCGLLKQFVQYDISQHQEGSSAWKGELCAPAQTLLHLHATLNNLQPFLQDLGKWLAFSKLYQSLELDSNILLHQVTSIEYQWAMEKLPYQQKHELADSLQAFLLYGLSLVRRFRDVFPPKSAQRLQSLLRVLVQMCKMKAFRELNPQTIDFQHKVTEALQEGTKEWFKMKKELHQPMVKSMEETVRALACLVREVKDDLNVNKEVWTKVFSSTVRVDVFTVNYLEFDALLAVEVQETLPSSTETQLSQEVADILYPLYLSLLDVHKAKSFIQNKDKVLALTVFHVRFRDALPCWLQKAYSTALVRIQRAVQVDQLKPLIENSPLIKHSSSAVDLATCFAQIRGTWNQLSWPDPEDAFMVMVKLTEDMCKITLIYCKMINQRAEELKSDNGDAANKLCVVVNNIEHLRSVLQKVPDQLDWAGLRQRTGHVIEEGQFRNTLYAQLQHAQGVLDRQICDAVLTLGHKLHADIENQILILADSHGPLPKPEDAVVSLMRFLEQELHYMNENLVQENFNSLLAPLWTHAIKILHRVSQQQVFSLEFYQRLQYALQCLEQCFHAEGNGLSLETLHAGEYKALKANLELTTLSNRELIQKYLDRKVTEQKRYSGEKYGAVTLIGSYKKEEQKLYIEVLNAVNLIPLDSNGASDPFVQLSLEPRYMFPEVETRNTKKKKAELNPLFEESFEFLVSPEQCCADGACLVLTVFDYDTLGTDDFEGEAFLSLKAIPGLRESQEPARTQQIRLPLMHPKPNEDNILKLLETRRSDREAQAFIKQRRQRERKSQEV